MHKLLEIYQNALNDMSKPLKALYERLGSFLIEMFEMLMDATLIYSKARE